MTDPNIARAKQALEVLSADPEAARRARDREMWHFFHDQELHLERKAGLITAVRTACELLGIELTAAREARLTKASTTELEELIESLKRDRRWAE